MTHHFLKICFMQTSWNLIVKWIEFFPVEKAKYKLRNKMFEYLLLLLLFIFCTNILNWNYLNYYWVFSNRSTSTLNVWRSRRAKSWTSNESTSLPTTPRSWPNVSRNFQVKKHLNKMRTNIITNELYVQLKLNRITWVMQFSLIKTFLYRM